MFISRSRKEINFIEILKKATDSIIPCFSYKDIPLLVSREIPKDEVWSVGKNVKYVIKNILLPDSDINHNKSLDYLK